MAAGVLNVARGENAAAADKSEDALVELRHGGVRTADAADRTRGEAGEQLLVRTVENDRTLIAPHFNILYRHGGVFHADHGRYGEHRAQKSAVQRCAGELRDVVDDEIRIRRGRGNIGPILRDRAVRQMEVDRGNGGDAVGPGALGVGGKLHAVARVVAGDVRDDRDAPGGLGDDGLQQRLAFRYGMIDAFTGRTADIKAVYTLLDEVFRERPRTGGRYLAGVVVACVEGREDPLVFIQVSCFHCFHSLCVSP